MPKYGISEESEVQSLGMFFDSDGYLNINKEVELVKPAFTSVIYRGVSSFDYTTLDIDYDTLPNTYPFDYFINPEIGIKISGSNEIIYFIKISKNIYYNPNYSGSTNEIKILNLINYLDIRKDSINTYNQNSIDDRIDSCGSSDRYFDKKTGIKIGLRFLNEYGNQTEGDYFGYIYNSPICPDFIGNQQCRELNTQFILDYQDGSFCDFFQNQYEIPFICPQTYSGYNNLWEKLVYEAGEESTPIDLEQRLLDQNDMINSISTGGWSYGGNEPFNPYQEDIQTRLISEGIDINSPLFRNRFRFNSSLNLRDINTLNYIKRLLVNVANYEKCFNFCNPNSTLECLDRDDPRVNNNKSNTYLNLEREEIDDTSIGFRSDRSDLCNRSCSDNNVVGQCRSYCTPARGCAQDSQDALCYDNFNFDTNTCRFSNSTSCMGLETLIKDQNVWANEEIITSRFINKLIFIGINNFTLQRYALGPSFNELLFKKDSNGNYKFFLIGIQDYLVNGQYFFEKLYQDYYGYQLLENSESDWLNFNFHIVTNTLHNFISRIYLDTYTINSTEFYRINFLNSSRRIGSLFIGILELPNGHAHYSKNGTYFILKINIFQRGGTNQEPYITYMAKISNNTNIFVKDNNLYCNTDSNYHRRPQQLIGQYYTQMSYEFSNKLMVETTTDSYENRLNQASSLDYLYSNQQIFSHIVGHDGSGTSEEPTWETYPVNVPEQRECRLGARTGQPQYNANNCPPHFLTVTPAHTVNRSRLSFSDRYCHNGLLKFYVKNNDLNLSNNLSVIRPERLTAAEIQNLRNENINFNNLDFGIYNSHFEKIETNDFDIRTFRYSKLSP